MSYNTKNHTEQNGEKTVIGGELEILPGAKIKADDGAEVEGFGRDYELPIASAETLGGIKTGRSLSMNGDVLNVNGASLSAYGTVMKAACQSSSSATTIEALVTEFNSLLEKLKAADIMQNET